MHKPGTSNTPANRRCKMKRIMSDTKLKRENVAHAGTGGVSQGNSGLGFKPAFLDFATQTIYPSRFADGRLAPFHILDGLPEEVVVDRAASGRVISAKATLISGFVRNGFFYTRSAAAKAAAEWAACVEE
jgi:hypothetical protein